MPEAVEAGERPKSNSPNSLGKWIGIGLLLGILCGLFFGEYCKPLKGVGSIYIGLLQMTVLPYLIVSLIANMGRLNAQQAKRLGLAAPFVLLALWGIGVALIIGTSTMLPPIQGAAFYSGGIEKAPEAASDYLSRFVPINIFHSLSSEYVPAIVVFCLFFGASLMLVPRKELLLELLDICIEGVGRINFFLVRLAPIGLFALTASAAGTLRLEELSRLQAYLFMLAFACVAATFAILPLLVSSLTNIRFRDFLSAAQEPLLTAIATGKLFVVLPQVEQKCSELVSSNKESEPNESIASIAIPLAYTLPHLGKILVFVFISFAAWYVGRELTLDQTLGMAATGVVSSFASPLVSIPYMLDKYQLPQDLMLFFILPGFITMRLGDAVGVAHLMAATLITNEVIERRVRVRWWRLTVGGSVITACLVIIGGLGHWYLSTTAPAYYLDDQLLALEVLSPHANVVVNKERSAEREIVTPAQLPTSTLDRLKQVRRLRVGYHPDHLPYSYFNSQGDLVGMDVELMHRLASSLDVELEFTPYAYDTVIEQLNQGEIDIAVGGLIINPERLLLSDFTIAYQTATIALVTPDHQREEFASWENLQKANGIHLGVLQKDMAAAVKAHFPEVDVSVVDSSRSYFDHRDKELNGLVMAAEEGAAWNILYPGYTVVVPQPVIKRPVGMAVRQGDVKWLRFLDRWLELERMEGSLKRLHSYWILGGGANERSRRWSIVQDELEWLP